MSELKTAESRSRPTARKGYPLAALFLLVAVCALLAGLLAIGVRGAAAEGVVTRAAATRMIAWIVAAASVTAMIGAACGAIMHAHKGVGAVLGLLAGAAAGAGCGAVAATTAPRFLEVLLLSGISAAMLLAVGIFMGARD
jgi:hypothetical protein